MSPANADQRVLGYLGRALSLELSAVQLYSTQAALASSWGLADVAEKFRAESVEEMGHAERIIRRMLALGVAPNSSVLRPVQLGASLKQLLQKDYEFENELINLYEGACRHCSTQGNHDDRVFFEALLDEEQAHARELQQWLLKIEQSNS